MLLRVLAAATILSGGLLPLSAVAADPPQTTIYTSGQATVSAPPDIAIVSFGLASHASTAEQATSASNTIYAHFNTGVRAIGIGSAEIRTTSYNLNYVPQPPPCPPPLQTQSYPVQECVRQPQESGYFVTRSVSVTIHHLDLVGKTIDTAVAAGVNNVESVEYGVSDTKSFFLRALGQAVVAARAQGDVMAQAAGLHIVRVQSINSSYATPLQTIAHISSRAMAAYPIPTQMSPPSGLDIQASVTVNFIAQP